MIYTKQRYFEAREKLEYFIKNDIRFRLEKVSYKRSLSQNAGFWLWMAYLEQITGTSKQVYHDYFLEIFPTRIEVIVNGMKKLVTITTSHPEMNTQRMSVLMNNIDQHCSTEFGITLPDLSEKNGTGISYERGRK